MEERELKRYALYLEDKKTASEEDQDLIIYEKRSEDGKLQNLRISTPLEEKSILIPGSLLPKMKNVLQKIET